MTGSVTCFTPCLGWSQVESQAIYGIYSGMVYCMVVPGGWIADNILGHQKAVLIGEKKYLEGRTAIIIDDMADTCGTVIKVGEVLISKGAKDVIIMVTHGILSGPALDRINNTDYIKEVVVSDTLPQEHNKKNCSKLKTFSIAPMLSEVITRLDKGGSLSEIFRY